MMSASELSSEGRVVRPRDLLGSWRPWLRKVTAPSGSAGSYPSSPLECWPQCKGSSLDNVAALLNDYRIKRPA